MEILTLLRANIKRRKGSFISTVLLCILILSCLWAFSSLYMNYEKGVVKAMDEADLGEILVLIKDSELTEELKDKLSKDENVDHITVYPSFFYSSKRVRVGQYEDGNGHAFIPMRDELKLMSSDLKAHVTDVPELQAGEIYLPLGLKTKFHCNVGDIYEVELGDEKVNLTIKGFVEEPAIGAETIGWKQVFISQTDYEKYMEKSKSLQKVKEEYTVLVDLIYVYPKEGCTLSGDDFRDAVNKNTGLLDKAKGSITREESKLYTTMMEQIVGGIMMAFSMILFVVVLIVITNSISNDIAYDYTNIGILKSQGFGSNKIRIIFSLGYLVAELMAAALAFIPARVLLGIISSVFISSTGILPKVRLSLFMCLLILASILAISVVVLIFSTKKISTISPMRAISGNKGDVHFSERGMVEVYGKGLLVRLAYRQISSGKKRYIGIMLIVMILVFFRMTAGETSNMLSSRTCWDAMGMDYSDVGVSVHSGYEGDIEELYADIIADTENYGGYERLMQVKNLYGTADGTQMLLVVKAYPEYITAVSKGRVPKYDNEILLTEKSAKVLEKNVGDMISITYGDNTEEFMVCGIGQEMLDAGKCIIISKAGMEKIVGEKVRFSVLNILMKDETKGKEFVDFLNEKYKDVIKADYTDLSEAMTGYEDVVEVLKYVINGFTIIFSIFVVLLACGKAFRQERRDIGIYKAMGMSTRVIRLSFALRYTLVAVMGCVLGMVMSVLLSEKCMELALSSIGLSRVKLAFLPGNFLSTIFLTGIVFFIFAYFASGKVKSVDVRELIQE